MSREKQASSKSEIGEDTAFLYLNGNIDHNSTRPIIEELLEIVAAPPRYQPENAILFINSNGGMLAPAIQLMDVMRQLPFPLATYGTGEVGSAGLLLLMSGTKGCRAATDSTILMTHQLSAGSEGKFHDLVAATKSHTMAHEMLVRRYQRCTGKTAAYIRRHLMSPDDLFMTAADAKKHGFIDQVIIID